MVGMPLVTVFAVPKAFRGHTDVIQTNAIGSWTRLNPRPEIILIGKDDGVAENAKKFGVEHVPQIHRNEFGTPLLNSAFELANRHGTGSILVYVNADIILTADFMPAIEMIPFRPFLLIGRRWNLDVEFPIDFSDRNWEIAIRKLLAERGELFIESAFDYFAFSRGTYEKIPPFAIGRFAWDYWLVLAAIRRGVTVIDGTSAITAIHQNHDYSHFPGGEIAVRNGEEAKRNIALYGIREEISTAHADYATGRSGLAQRVRSNEILRSYQELMAQSNREYRIWRTLREGIGASLTSLGINDNSTARRTVARLYWFFFRRYQRLRSRVKDGTKVV